MARSARDRTTGTSRAFSLAEIDGISLVSPGLEPSATTAVPGPHPQITVSYTLKRPWLPARPWMLTLRTEPAGAAVPRMVLVANERAVPLSADDGEIVARLPAGQDGATHAIRTPLNLSRISVRAFLDPTIDPASLPPSAFAIPRRASLGYDYESAREVGRNLPAPARRPVPHGVIRVAAMRRSQIKSLQRFATRSSVQGLHSFRPLRGFGRMTFLRRPFLGSCRSAARQGTP